MRIMATKNVARRVQVRSGRETPEKNAGLQNTSTLNILCFKFKTLIGYFEGISALKVDCHSLEIF